MKLGPKLTFLSVFLLSASAISLNGCDNRQEVPGSATPNATVGTQIDDSIITAKVKSSLLADAAMKGLDPKVETHKGVAQLSGFVENQAQIERAMQITRAVEGVKDVENKMTIKQ